VCVHVRVFVCSVCVLCVCCVCVYVCVLYICVYVYVCVEFSICTAFSNLNLYFLKIKCFVILISREKWQDKKGNKKERNKENSRETFSRSILRYCDKKIISSQMFL